MDNNELYHHGVLGMKWGVRRYQNKNGVLTSAGKKRRSMKFPTSKKVQPHEDYIKAHTKKSVTQMSDAELRSRINRLQMEKQYKDLNVSAGKQKVNNILKTAGSVSSAMNTGINLYTNTAKVKKILREKL